MSKIFPFILLFFFSTFVKAEWSDMKNIRVTSIPINLININSLVGETSFQAWVQENNLEGGKAYAYLAESKNNEGLLINPNSGSSMFVIQDLDPSLYFLIEKMQEGEVSSPVIMLNTQGEKAYRLVKLRKKTSAHTANLTDDYDKIQNAALSEKKQETINNWLKEKIAKTYIKVEENLQNCTFDYNWNKK